MGPLSKIIGMEFPGLSWNCIGLRKESDSWTGLSAEGYIDDYKGAQGSVLDLSSSRKAPSAKAFWSVSRIRMKSSLKLLR